MTTFYNLVLKLKHFYFIRFNNFYSAYILHTLFFYDYFTGFLLKSNKIRSSLPEHIPQLITVIPASLIYLLKIFELSCLVPEQRFVNLCRLV